MTDDTWIVDPDNPYRYVRLGDGKERHIRHPEGGNPDLALFWLTVITAPTILLLLLPPNSPQPAPSVSPSPQSSPSPSSMDRSLNGT